MLLRLFVLVVVALMLVLSGCAGAPRGGSVAAPGDGSYTLRVDLAIAGELANDRGHGAVRADLTGELTFAAVDSGTQVHSRIVAVRDVYVDPRLTRRSEGPDPRVLRTVLLSTDDYWPLEARPGAPLAPAPAARQTAIAFFYEVFTRDLAAPTWLPAQMPAEGSSLKTTRHGLHGGIEAEIEETLTLVRIDRTGDKPVAEFTHTSAIRSAVSSGADAHRALEVHERGVLRVDLASGLPVRHTRQRTELLIEDGARVVHNSFTIEASYAAVAVDARRT